MAIHFSVLAWRVPEEAWRAIVQESQGVGHNCMAAHMHVWGTGYLRNRSPFLDVTVNLKLPLKKMSYF